MTAAPPPSHPARPGTVTVGAIMAWTASAFLVAGGVVLVAGVNASDAFGVVAAAAPVLTATGAAVILAGLLGALLTTVTYRGSRGALAGLTVLAVIGVLARLGAWFWLLASVEATLAVPIRSLLGIVWVLVAIVLLWLGNSWYRSRGKP